MIPPDKDLAFYMSAIDGLMLRQRVIAHNIANQNTPRFRAKRVDFEETMLSLLKEGGRKRAEFHVRESKEGPFKVDGNNVFLEREWMLLERTRVLHELFTKAVGGTFRTLLTGIRSR